MKTIQTLENSEHVKDEIKIFEQSVLGKKRVFNKIRHENLSKEEQLEQLEEQLRILVSQCDDFTGQQDYLEEKGQEYEKMVEKLREKLIYQENLENMIVSRKKSLVKMSEPIRNKRKEINLVVSELEKHYKIIQKENDNIKQFEKELKQDQLILEQLKKEKEDKLKAEIKFLLDKKKFRYCIKKEQEKNVLLELHTIEAKKLLKLESDLSKLKSDEKMMEELKDIETHVMKQEEKFLEIQKITNIVSVNDMYPHYVYLRENKARLKDSVNQALQQIEKLNDDRKNVGKELEELKFKALSNLQSNKEIQMKEETFKQRMFYLENFEDYIEKLDCVVNTAISSLSRLMYQLDLLKKIKEITPDNLIDCFKECKNKLDTLINEIKNNNFEATESVNTDINVRRLPHYLNLNPKSLKIVNNTEDI
jgi:hypothetical protein